MVDLSAIELYTKKNPAGKFQQKRSFDLENTSGGKTTFVIKMKYSPSKVEAPVEKKEEEPPADDDAPQDEEED